MPINPDVIYTVDQQRGFSKLIRRPPSALDLAKFGPGEQFMSGSIRWQKTLGRPNSNKMADGFNILMKHGTVELIGDAAGGPAHEVTLVTPVVVTNKWDADDDDEFHYVDFVQGSLSSDTVYTVEVALAPGAEWSDDALAGTWIRSVEPERRVFTKDQTSVWLEPFEVIVRPFIFLPT